MSETRRLPVVVCVDVEPDLRAPDPNGGAAWEGVEASFALLGAARPRLAAATGCAVRMGWFLRMDPMVARLHGSADWAVVRHRSSIDAVLASGDEVGLHVHPCRFDTGCGAWVTDCADQGWVETCIDDGLFAFRSSLGRPCAAFRLGDRWMNQATMRRLSGAGVRYELTLEPGQPTLPVSHPGEEFRGVFDDTSSAPRVPYHPSSEDYLVAAAGAPEDLWEIPLTTRPSERWRGRVSRRLHAHGRRTRPMVSTLKVGDAPEVFARVFQRALADPSTRHLAMAMRTDDAIDPVRRESLARNLEWLIAHPRARMLRFVTPRGCVEGE